jgi:eukaryotic-like serine/threonine-protein kinase
MTNTLGAPTQNVPGVREGDILAGKYRIDKILGAGGMGVVVAAHHIQLDERVAIKFLLPDALGNQEAVARFAREARAAVKIKSEHVARVIDVGTLETGAPYMVMEYLEGGDLAARVHQQGPLPVEQAVEFILQACEAIAEAHALGIVHRDLKPANLFCIRRADNMLSIKVLDFGISKVTGMSGSGPDMSMTKTTAVMGSPLYMSPEQMQSSRNVDARTDIWALGIILYELLAGEVPFCADTMPELCMQILVGSPAPIAMRRGDIPPGLEQVIAKSIQKDRGHRYANVAEFAMALSPFGPRRARASVERIARVIQGAGLSASALALPPSSDTSIPPPPAPTVATWGGTAPGSKAGVPIVVWIGLGGVLAIAGVVVAMLVIKKTTPQVTQATVVQAPATTQAAAPTPATLPKIDPPPAPPLASSSPIAAAPPPVEPPASAAKNAKTAGGKPRPFAALQPPPATAKAPAAPPPAKPPAPAGNVYDDRR